MACKTKQCPHGEAERQSVHVNAIQAHPSKLREDVPYLPTKGSLHPSATGHLILDGGLAAGTNPAVHHLRAKGPSELLPFRAASKAAILPPRTRNLGPDLLMDSSELLGWLTIHSVGMSRSFGLAASETLSAVQIIGRLMTLFLQVGLVLAS